MKLTHINDIQPPTVEQQLAKLNQALAKMQKIEKNAEMLRLAYDRQLLQQERMANQMQILLNALAEIREIDGVNIRGQRPAEVAHRALITSAMLIN